MNGKGCILLLVVAQAAALAQNGTEDFLCWRRSFGRGAGSVPGDCPAGQVKDAGLCYAACKPGMQGVGPVCWSTCPAGYRDDGAFCAKPQPYGRGSGYALWNEKKCRDENGGNCEKNGALWYPVCKPGFHAVGCCVCSPDCPPGMADIGVSCAKESYGRGAGAIPNCGGGKLADAGLCYGSCPRDYTSVGPVCWGNCPPEKPVNCGAGCAVNKAACAAAILEMNTEVLSVAANILLTVAGAPGTMKAVKEAAQKGADAAVRVMIRGGYGTFSQGMRIGAKAAAKDFGETVVRKAVTYALDGRNVIGYSKSLSKFAGLRVANEVAREFGAAKLEGQFDYTLFLAADPAFGVSSLVYAFAKYDTCDLEDVVPDVADVDFGPEPVKDSDVRTITLRVQNPTTITEITSTPLKGCAIVPESDCLGRDLKPGDTCKVNVRVTGGGSAVGSIGVYTKDYDIIPMAFGVRSRGQNGKECDGIPGSVEAVNLTGLAGVWAWNNDVKRKVIVKQDGTVQSFRGAGRATVLDPVKRTFAITIGSSAAEFVELAKHRETLTLATGSPAMATRRPWDEGCQPGEQKLLGLCYDVPIGYEVTAPGFIGKPCPFDWRDEGTRCFPPWKGKKVNLQADPEGSFPMRHPILVTDCANYSQAKKQACPAYFKNTGGPVGCTCEAIPMSRQVKSLIGSAPR